MKNYINKVFIGGLLVGMSLTASSCGEDFLDTAPTSSTGASDAVGTTANHDYAAVFFRSGICRRKQHHGSL